MPLSRFSPFRGASLISSAELLREPKRTTVDAKRRGQSRSQLSGLLPAQQQWQLNAWGYYRTCGELRQGVRWLSNACSRATLKLGRVDPRGDGTPEPIDDRALIDRYLTSWAGGAEGQSELLGQMAIHATVPGEWYLIAYADPATGAEVWRTVAKSAIQQLGTGQDSPLRVQIGPHEWVDLENGASFVCRMWRPDPEKPWLADSPVQPLLADLRILCGLTAHVNATIDSRLAGNGILAVPQEASLTGAETAPVDDEGTVREDADEFMDELIELGDQLVERQAAFGLVTGEADGGGDRLTARDTRRQDRPAVRAELVPVLVGARGPRLAAVEEHDRGRRLPALTQRGRAADHLRQWRTALRTGQAGVIGAGGRHRHYHQISDLQHGVHDVRVVLRVAYVDQIDGVWVHAGVGLIGEVHVSGDRHLRREALDVAAPGPELHRLVRVVQRHATPGPLKRVREQSRVGSAAHGSGLEAGDEHARHPTGAIGSTVRLWARRDIAQLPKPRMYRTGRPEARAAHRHAPVPHVGLALRQERAHDQHLPP